MSDDLAAELSDAFPGAVTEPLPSAGWRVLLPNPRLAHEYVALSVEPSDGGWILSDGGDLRWLAGDDLPAVTKLLNCAGGRVEPHNKLVISYVSAEESLAAEVLSFGYLLLSAPALWQARNCLTAEPADEPVDSNSSDELARQTRTRLIERCGRRSGAVIRVNRTQKLRGEISRLPLSIAPPAADSLPRLVAGFVDMETSRKAQSAAKRAAAWMFEVLYELSIPKFVVVRGTETDLQHAQDFYDHHNVVAVPAGAPTQLEEEAFLVVDGMGL